MEAPSGSGSVLPAEFNLGPRTVTMAELVRRAQHDSGLGVDGWAALHTIEQDWWLVSVAHAMRAEAAAPPFARA